MTNQIEEEVGNQVEVEVAGESQEMVDLEETRSLKMHSYNRCKGYPHRRLYPPHRR